MNGLALTIAVMGFFVLAIVGWLGGCTPFTCAVRGLIGGAAVFGVVRFALKLLVNIIADIMARAEMSQENESERPKA